jgi:hypothetical protein
MRASYRNAFAILIMVSLCLTLCGCSELKYHKLFNAALIGSAVGGIVGYQSDECPAGIAVGAAVCATGELLHQIDHIGEQKEREIEEAAEEVARGDSLLDSVSAER